MSLLSSCWPCITHLNYSNLRTLNSPVCFENFKDNVKNIKYESQLKFKHSVSLP